MKKHYQPKHILLVGPVPPPMGGMSLQTMHFYQALKKEKHQVSLVASNIHLRPRVLNKITVLRTLIRSVLFMHHLIRQVPKADVVHLMSNSGLSWFLVSAPTLAVARWFKVRVIVNYRGGSAQTFLKSYRFWVHLSLKNAYAIVVPSLYLAQVFEQYGYKTHVIPNTVDTVRFRPNSMKPKTFQCLVARNLEHIYGVDIAVRALHLVRKTHPQFTLCIAGEGSQKHALKALVSELELDDYVSFLGRLSREDMARTYAQSSLLVNPSRVDNMPNALLEAQAAGVPIVTSSVGGIPFMVEHNKTALIVEPDNFEALARAMIALCEDPTLRANLIQHGLDNIQRFTWDSIKLKWEVMYDEVG